MVVNAPEAPATAPQSERANRYSGRSARPATDCAPGGLCRARPAVSALRYTSAVSVLASCPLRKTHERMMALALGANGDAPSE